MADIGGVGWVVVAAVWGVSQINDRITHVSVGG